MRGKPFDEEMCRTIRAEYDNEVSIYRLSRKYRVHPDRIKAAIESAGGSMRNPSDWSWRQNKISREQSAEIASRFLRGETKKDLARDFKVSYSTITHHLKKAGIAA